MDKNWGSNAILSIKLYMKVEFCLLNYVQVYMKLEFYSLNLARMGMKIELC